MKNLILTCLMLGYGYCAYAQNRTVTNTNDAGVGSLRWAVLNSGPGDAIYFSPALLASGSDTIFLQSTIQINSGRSFYGIDLDTAKLYISGSNTVRIFDVDFTNASARKLYLNRMSFINGYSAGTSSSDGGGALRLRLVDTLLLSNIQISGCSAQANASAIYSKSIYNGSLPLFGAYPRYTLIDQARIENNASTSQGIHAIFFDRAYRMQVRRSSFINNKDASCSFTNYSQVEVDSCTFNFNGNIQVATTHALWVQSTQVEVKESYFNNNVTFGASALSIDLSDTIRVRNSHFNSNRSMVGSSTGWGGAATINQRLDPLPAQITNCVFRKNRSNFGGALYLFSAEVDSCSFIGNESSFGGAILFYTKTNSQIHKLSHSVLDSNRSTTIGAQTAGAIYNTAWPLTVEHSSITNNLAGGLGGAIISNGGDISIVNSTIANNTANNKGGAFHLNGANLSVKSSTLIHNRGLNGGNLAHASSARQISLGSSLIYNPGDTAFSFNGSNPPQHNIQSTNYNIVDFYLDNGMSEDIDLADSSFYRLEPLALNGGIGYTALPKLRSWAVNRGDPTDSSLAQNDSIHHGRRDIGAAESPHATNRYRIWSTMACDSLEFNGNFYSQATRIVDSVAPDSVVLVKLLGLYASFDSTHVVESCGPFTWIDGMTYHRDSDTSYLLSTTAEGCDSIHRLHFRRLADTSVLVTDTSAIVLADSVGIEWYDCSTNPWQKLNPPSSKPFVPLANGSYAAVISEGSCVDTTRCITFSKIGLGESRVRSLFVYPNPSDGKVYLQNSHGAAVVKVYNLTGQLLQESHLHANEALQLPDAPGLYYLEQIDGDVTYRAKVLRR